MSNQVSQATASDLRLTVLGPQVLKDLNADEQAIGRQIERWQRLFSPGDKRYSLEGYEDLFAQEKDELLVYDNFSPDNSGFTGFDTYRDIWEREINEKFPGLLLYHIEIDRIKTNGELGFSAFTWWGSIVIDGELQYSGQHATHIWRKIDGEWRIVHEHLTGPVIENGKQSRR